MSLERYLAAATRENTQRSYASALPFSALDRLARRVRTLVNGRYFALIDKRLTADEKQRLDDLLVVTDARIKSPLQAIKRGRGSQSPGRGRRCSCPWPCGA